MAIMKKRALKKEYVQVPNETAKAVEQKDNENIISLESLGLLVNLWSYNVETWELHKTELYKRYGKNKKRSVMSAWDDLVENKYIVEFKYRNGRKWEYVYHYRIEPFSPEEIEEIMAESVEEYGVSSTSDFVHLKMGSSNCTVQNVHISNEKGKKEKLKKDNNNSFVNKESDNQTENIPLGDKLVNIANTFYGEFASGRWSKKQWSTLVYALISEILADRRKIENYEAYIYGALKNIARSHDLKDGKVTFTERNSKVALYNWLED